MGSSTFLCLFYCLTNGLRNFQIVLVIGDLFRQCLFMFELSILGSKLIHVFFAYVQYTGDLICMEFLVTRSEVVETMDAWICRHILGHNLRHIYFS